MLTGGFYADGRGQMRLSDTTGTDKNDIKLVKEFFDKVHQKIYISATPGDFERESSQQIVEQIIRPTGLLDPLIEVRPTAGQIDDLIGEINITVKNGQRILVTTLTKKMAESLTDYLKDAGIKEGFIITELNDMAVNTADDVERIYNKVMKSGDEHVLIAKGIYPTTGKKYFYAINLGE